ncbi:MAG: hypothetical protein AAF552_03290 [Pseudomonadota bacterium]
MYTLNEQQLDAVAGGETPNNPIWDAPIGAIFQNFRNAGASVSSATYQTFRVLRAPLTVSGATGAFVGTQIYDAMSYDTQMTIGGTISTALDNIQDFFGLHIH